MLKFSRTLSLFDMYCK